MRQKFSERGFTMTELLVAMVISVIVMAGVYSSYYAQQRSFTTQQQVAAMQQNLRAAIEIMDGSPPPIVSVPRVFLVKRGREWVGEPYLGDIGVPPQAFDRFG